MKCCVRCGADKPLDDFHRSKRSKDGRLGYCADCANRACRQSKARRRANGKARAYYLATREALQDTLLRRNFGITLDQYRTLLARQDGVCAICGQPPRYAKSKYGIPMSLAVDHDHASGKIRGLLCLNCNRGLGYFHDDPSKLRSAIAYLAR